MEGYKLQHQLDEGLRRQVVLENERDEVAAELQQHKSQLLKYGLLALLRMALLVALGQLLWPGRFTLILFVCAAAASEFIFVPKYRAPSLWTRWREVVRTKKHLSSLQALVEESRVSDQR